MTKDRQQLRNEKTAARNAMTPKQREEASAALCRRILASDAFRQAKTVFLYRAVRGEASLSVLEQTAGDKLLAYPYCADAAQMLALQPLTASAWQRGRFGLLEPVPEQALEIAPEKIDLVICPCVAFDDGCNRLGMGGGFYDRFLPQCKNAVVAAAAFELQRCDSLPLQVWDFPMDAVFTESAVYQTTQKKGA